MSRSITLAATFAVAVSIAGAGAALAGDVGVKAGALTCTLTSSTNMVLVSGGTFDCVYAPGGDGATEHYTGAIDKIGVDLTVINEKELVWVVFAPSNDTAPGALDGAYVGVSADAALGVALGAKVLVGGGDNAFTLQPAVLSGGTGVGAAVGLEQFRLTWAGPKA